MIVETIKNETLIRIPSSIDYRIVQSVIDYFRIVEILMKNQGTEADALQLSNEVDNNWWKKNKKRFIE